MIQVSLCKGKTCLYTSATSTQGNIVAIFTGVTILATALVIVNKSLNT